MVALCYYYLSVVSISYSPLIAYHQTSLTAKMSEQEKLPMMEIDMSDEAAIDIINSSHSSPSSALIRRILIWTGYFGQPSDLSFGQGQNMFENAGCGVSNCWVTQDRSWLSRCDAVVFQGEPMDFNVSDLPMERRPHQRYIYLNWEPLAMEEMLGTKRHEVLANIPPHFFNWTMTHRRDSDVYHPLHYGVLKRIRSTTGAKTDWNETLPHKLNPGQLPSAFIGLERESLWASLFLRNKTGMMAWFVSHCSTSGKREEYVEELSRYMQIDIYGKCGNLTCHPRNSDECGAKVMSRYKFYFSAENSLCPDYVTEKFYRALIFGAVPVVYGGADYSAYAPPGSYIHVADFRTPKDLAVYLRLLDRNDELYLTYFRWRKDWEVIRPWMGGFCDLCRKLNDPLEPIKSYANLSDFWYNSAPCYPPSYLLKELLYNKL